MCRFPLLTPPLCKRHLFALCDSLFLPGLIFFIPNGQSSKEDLKRLLIMDSENPENEKGCGKGGIGGDRMLMDAQQGSVSHATKFVDTSCILRRFMPHFQTYLK